MKIHSYTSEASRIGQVIQVYEIQPGEYIRFKSAPEYICKVINGHRWVCNTTSNHQVYVMDYKDWLSYLQRVRPNSLVTIVEPYEP
jgi:hypothetical protein